MAVTLDQIQLLINEENKLVTKHFDEKFDKLSDRIEKNSRDVLVIKVVLGAAAFFGGGGYGVWKLLVGI